MTEPGALPTGGPVTFFPPAGVTLILATGTVWAGRVVEDKPITEQLVVAGAFIVLATAIVNQISRGFAAAFAMLIWIATILVYGLPILESVGIASRGAQ